MLKTFQEKLNYTWKLSNFKKRGVKSPLNTNKGVINMLTSVEKLENLEKELWGLEREIGSYMKKSREYTDEMFYVRKQLRSTILYTLPDKKNTDFHTDEQLKQNVIDMEKISKWYKYKHEKAKALYFGK